MNEKGNKTEKKEKNFGLKAPRHSTLLLNKLNASFQMYYGIESSLLSLIISA